MSKLVIRQRVTWEWLAHRNRVTFKYFFCTTEYYCTDESRMQTNACYFSMNSTAIMQLFLSLSIWLPLGYSFVMTLHTVCHTFHHVISLLHIQNPLLDTACRFWMPTLPIQYNIVQTSGNQHSRQIHNKKLFIFNSMYRVQLHSF